MTLYLIKLLILLPLFGAMIVGGLWLYRKYQPALTNARANRLLQVREVLPMGAAGKLMVVSFDGRNILLGITRGRIARIDAAISDRDDHNA
ncbi:MAG: flagellar biosynthetic protein FliO [Parasphingorhabdus sp.]|nr:flagellar biosynthetic protein FliO [Parasphingorhabdus sp.]